MNGRSGMRHRMWIWILFALCATRAYSAESKGFDKWERDIQAFEERDNQQFPPKDGILFVGSSSIRLWNVEKSFPNRPVINRGFGGSTAAEAVHFMDRIVVPYRPKFIVFYSGDNDVAFGTPPEKVFENFRAFALQAHQKLPDARVIILSIKPSPSRWKLVEKVKEVNRRVEAFVQEQSKEKNENSKKPWLEFLDVFTPMLGEDGLPKQELFVADKLHMNEVGYALWTRLLEPKLNSD